MVALRVRPAVCEANVETALQSVARALQALGGVAQWSAGNAHALSGPRLARLAEKRLETLREALKDAREAFALLREKDGSRQPSGSAMENAVAAASAALAVVRAGRGRLESATADVRGQGREGPTASPASFARERQMARTYLERLAVLTQGVPSVPYQRALQLETESQEAARERQTREAALSAAKDDAKRANEESELLKRELAMLQDVCRTQRGQLQRMAEKAQKQQQQQQEQQQKFILLQQQQQQQQQQQHQNQDQEEKREKQEDGVGKRLKMRKWSSVLLSLFLLRMLWMTRDCLRRDIMRFAWRSLELVRI